MKRRLIRLGGSALVISLPSKWSKEQGLKPGQEVEVEPDGAQLRISTGPGAREERTVALRFSEEDWRGPRPEKYVQRMLAAAYKQGADKIIIECDSKKILDYIEQRIEGFIGIEIIDQQRGKLVIRSLVEGLEMEFESVLSRAIIMTGHISAETVRAVKESDGLAIDNLLRLERTHNKIIDFAKRMLAKRSAGADDKYLYSFLVEDERLVDEYKHLLQACRSRPGRKAVALLAETDAYLQLLLDVVRRQDPAQIRALSGAYLPLREKLRSLLAEREDAQVLLHLHNIVVKAYEMGETVLEWKLR